MLSMNCNCSQGEHTAPVKHIEVSSGAIEKLAQILEGYTDIMLVADKNTYKVAGARAEQILRNSGMLSHVCVIDDPPLPSDQNVGRVLIEADCGTDSYDINSFSNNPKYILGVGSGSVNDICRMVSYRLGIEYGILGTAPSMDGYASVVAPLLVGTKKIIYTCSIARHIIIDLDICQNAPYELLLAGLGDMIGKYVAILDWELSRDVTGEYYCAKIAEMVKQATGACIESASGLQTRSVDAIKNTVDGLILSGLCIAYSGSSRPASGTEHMVGQTWEVMDLEKGHLPNLHGIEVGEATFAAMLMYMRVYRETKEQWLKDLIKPYIPSFEKVLELQKTIKIPFTVKEKQTFITGILRGKTFRVRYTLLQYLYDRGELEEYADWVFEECMKYAPMEA